MQGGWARPWDRDLPASVSASFHPHPGHPSFVLQELLETVSDDYLICKYCTNFTSLNCIYSRIKTCITDRWSWWGCCEGPNLPRPHLGQGELLTEAKSWGPRAWVSGRGCLFALSQPALCPHKLHTKSLAIWWRGSPDSTTASVRETGGGSAQLCPPASNPVPQNSSPPS